MKDTDALGRCTFHHIAARPGIRPTPRESRWLKHIEQHGPQSSFYLHELTSNTHRDPDTSRRQLQKLRAGGYLFCPPKQRATEHASFNPYIYDLTPLARDHLADCGMAEHAITPSGHWVHRSMTACITASIDITAMRAGVGYLPAHRILARRDATLGCEINGRRLIPDHLFGLDYGGQYRFFCVEADGGTEPVFSAAARKSLRILAEQYRALIGGKLYRDHYGLTAGMLLLAVFSSAARRRFLEAASEIMAQDCACMLTQTVPEFHASFRPPALLTRLFERPWNRPKGHFDFLICRP